MPVTYRKIESNNLIKARKTITLLTHKIEKMQAAHAAFAARMKQKLDIIVEAIEMQEGAK